LRHCTNTKGINVPVDHWRRRGLWCPCWTQWAPDLQGIRKVSGPLRFPHSIEIHIQIHLYSVMYSPPFWTTHLNRFIQLWKTLWTSSNVRSFQAIIIASPISSCEWNSQSFRISFNIQKSQKSHGLKFGE
jgi:hypothetical protein